MIDAILCCKEPTDTFLRTINSIMKQDEISKIIIVTTSDVTKNLVEMFGNPNLIVVKEPDRFCLSWARRLGVNYTTEKYVIYVDSDVVLGDGYFKDVFEKAKELEAKYGYFAIEGIMYLVDVGKNEEDAWLSYEERYLKKGERGFTHNTLLLRENLLSWNPIYTFAWEDYNLTQHILDNGGVWLRFLNSVITYHYREYDTWRRVAWNTAGERIVRQTTIFQILFKIVFRSFGRIYRGIRRRKIEEVFKIMPYLIGTLRGWLKSVDYLKLTKVKEEVFDEEEFIKEVMLATDKRVKSMRM